ncbi:MAG: TauD/TfdA family dioxygenase [Desmonostoc vinosum HA7617-LM4]|jgi:UDP:flavonoid glycosyltransferase YjiC (YdhE family)/alpha-ketoglutarate-dependent taurine dioxygenase|nr:TauD/TfdA family dioxygenase [Desmonostoc vinosum HA7617-LM4]
MAKILLITHWSTGEVYPFIQIGSTLKTRGHDVTLITNCQYEKAVLQAELNFIALDTPEEFDHLSADGHLFNSPQGFLTIYQKYVLPKIFVEYQAIAKHHHPHQTVLIARDTPGIAARIAAEKLNIPLLAVMSSPSHLSTRSLVAELIGSIFGDEINQIRAKMGLVPVSDWLAWLRLPDKTIGLWPDWFAPKSSGVLQTGFVWHDQPSTNNLPAELREVHGEEPPILITGGTTSLAGAKFFAVSAEACQLLQRRGLLVTRHAKLVPENLPSLVKWVQYLPSMVSCMPYTSAVIHHGGLVTSGQAIASGIPQLALAMGADQLYTGSCLSRVGVGECLPPSQWQAKVIAESLEQLINSPTVQQRCQELLRRIIDTNPVAVACDAIEALIPQNDSYIRLKPTLQPENYAVKNNTEKNNFQTSNLLQLTQKLSPEKLALLELRLMKKHRDVAKTIPAIPRNLEQNYFPLAFAQQRLWFLDQLAPGNPTYNISGAVRLMGTLNVTALEESFNTLVQRHEVLRTTFTTKQEQPVQVIAPADKFTLPVLDLQGLSKAEQQQQIQKLAIREQQRSFDLTTGPLLRVSLLQLNQTEHVMLFSMHHIISDGWSMGILIREIATLYASFSTGKHQSLPELSIQYADFALWQRQWLVGQVLETQLTYWKQQLGGNIPILNLPCDRPRPKIPSFQGATHSFILPASLSQALQKLSQQENATLFMTLLAALQTLLYRYTNQEDIVVGTDVANRNRAETEALIGFFINLLVLRTDLSGNPSFRELLKRVREVALGAYAHQDLPFAKLVEELQPERNLQPTPLFQVLFVMQNTPMSPQSLLGLEMAPIEVDNKTAKFDLALFINETEQGLIGSWNYSTDLFDATTITRMTGHFQTLLENIVSQPETRIDSLEMLTTTEKKQQIIQKRERQTFKREKLMKVVPKAVNLLPEQLIKIDDLEPGQTFPLVIQPNNDEIDLIVWAKNNRELIETKLLKSGAILFRGFHIQSTLEFESFAQAICPKLFGEYGDLPRTDEGGKVYGSTPYPADKAILFHNESSHLHSFPLKIWFFCLQPAAKGGETPIIDCRQAYRILDPKLRDKLAEKQLMYVRNYTDSLDVSWQEFFQTHDQNVVERICKQAKIDFEWHENNGLVTRQIRPALAIHPKTDEPVFFNQIQLHHINYLDSEVRESLLSLFSEHQLPRNVYYGDGTPIEDSAITEINEVYRQSQTSFSWQKGDILMLDNMLAAHGRNPYVGSRKIVVAMGEMINSADIIK